MDVLLAILQENLFEREFMYAVSRLPEIYALVIHVASCCQVISFASSRFRSEVNACVVPRRREVPRQPHMYCQAS
jgi:hypothetical protein